MHIGISVFFLRFNIGVKKISDGSNKKVLMLKNFPNILLNL